MTPLRTAARAALRLSLFLALAALALAATAALALLPGPNKHRCPRRPLTMPPTDPDTDLQRLVKAARRMRAQQNVFFRTKDLDTRRNVVTICKSLERDFDALLDELDPPQAQAALFDTARRRGAYGRED